MANPQITVVRTPAGVVAPGTQVSFAVTATDGDARSVSYTFNAVDSQSQATQVTETVVVSDPVTVTATVDDPSETASDPAQDPTNPTVWRSTV
jgi:hypothetical protein